MKKREKEMKKEKEKKKMITWIRKQLFDPSNQFVLHSLMW